MLHTKVNATLNDPTVAIPELPILITLENAITVILKIDGKDPHVIKQVVYRISYCVIKTLYTVLQ